MPRDLLGVVTLPVGNPVVSGTAISADVQNATVADLASMIEDSLSRSGKGGMTSPMQFVVGTAAAPSITFVGDTNTGVNSPSGGEVDLVADATVALRATATTVTVPLDLAVTGNLVVTGTINGGGSAGEQISAGNVYGGNAIAPADFSDEITLPTASGKAIVIGTQPASGVGPILMTLTTVAPGGSGVVYLYRKIGAGAYASIAVWNFYTVVAALAHNIVIPPMLDTPGAGAITYKLMYQCALGTSSMMNDAFKLYAYEL